MLKHHLKQSFSRPLSYFLRAPAGEAVVADAATWTLADVGGGGVGRVVSVALPRPAVAGSDRGPCPPPKNTNATAARPWGGPPGVPFFADDDDPHGLGDVLAAAVLAAGGAPRVRGVDGASRIAVDADGLPPGARRHLDALLDAEEEEGGEVWG